MYIVLYVLRINSITLHGHNCCKETFIMQQKEIFHIITE